MPLPAFSVDNSYVQDTAVVLTAAGIHYEVYHSEAAPVLDPTPPVCMGSDHVFPGQAVEEEVSHAPAGILEAWRKAVSL